MTWVGVVPSTVMDWANAGKLSIARNREYPPSIPGITGAKVFRMFIKLPFERTIGGFELFSSGLYSNQLKYLANLTHKGERFYLLFPLAFQA